MKALVAFVICAAFTVSAAAAGAVSPSALSQAERLSGLRAQRPIRTVTESSVRFNADAVRVLDRDYPRALQSTDDRMYEGLGLLPSGTSARARLVASATEANAIYDPGAKVLRIRRRPAPTRAQIVHELARALVDQNVGLRRLSALRTRDRDASLAANAVVDGLAAVASGRRPNAVAGSPLERFLSVEHTAGLGPGRIFVLQLSSVGGTFAVSTALRTFPHTTEQLLHLDAFLERTRPLPVTLPTRVDDRALQTSESLRASETFGELDVGALLGSYGLARDDVAAGWRGGRLARYAGADNTETVALVLRWDSSADAAAWRALAPALVLTAFPAAQERVCPAVDRCWVSGSREIALASVRDLTVLASGSAGELVAATIAR